MYKLNLVSLNKRFWKISGSSNRSCYKRYFKETGKEKKKRKERGV